MPRKSILGFALLLPSVASAFYIPGWSIRSYKEGEPVPLSTNKLTSDNTQLPYAYHEQPFVCQAQPNGFGSKFGSSRAIGLNLGEILRGDRIQISDYELRMGKDNVCKHLCDRVVNRHDVEIAKEMIKGDSTVEWIVDNLPGATSFLSTDHKRRYYAPGFKLGGYEAGKAFINNHVTLVIKWRKARKPTEKIIVAFEVYPKSIKGPKGACPESLDSGEPLELALPETLDATMTIPYTYSVYWKEDNTIEWSSRWDMYFLYNEGATRVHWLSIFVSIILALLLTGTVAMIMVRTLSRDIQSYKMTNIEGGAPDQEDDDLLDDIVGWKLVHGDVFRPPQMGGLFAPLVGSGVQLFAMGGALVVLSALGFLNPSYRGGFISFALFLFAFAGVFSGYISSRVFKTFKGESVFKNAIMTASVVPGSIFLAVLLLNFVVWAQSSSTALPFGTLVALAAIWLLILLPLVIAGSYYGFRKPAWEYPSRINAIARQIPPQPWYLNTFPSIFFGGMIPFMVIFIELLYVYQSVWNDKGYYYVFGFLAVIVSILALAVAEISIVFTYFLLCAENYHWWWRSFLIGASPAIWVYVYSAYYFYTKLHIEGFVSGLLYFAYSGLACALFGLASGTVAVLSSFIFVRKIYTAIKSD